MKKGLIILFFQTLLLGLVAQDSNLEMAAEAYSKGEFTTAAELYENQLETSGESAKLYYNIGNCYYKMDRIASAILNYERALLLDPGDKDARFNLEIAKLKTVDRIDPLDEFFLNKWIHSVQNIFSTNEWSRIGIAFFLLLIGSLFLFFFSRKIILKKVGFYTGLFWLVIVIASNSFAYNQKQKLLHRDTAIVFAPTVTIKSSPDNSGNDLFILHEGTKVTIKSTLGNWSEIQISDGNVGWIKNSDIQII